MVKVMTWDFDEVIALLWSGRHQTDDMLDTGMDDGTQYWIMGRWCI